MERFEIHQTDDWKYYFVLLDRNGNQLVRSITNYTRKQYCYGGITVLRNLIRDHVPTYDMTVSEAEEEDGESCEDIGRAENDVIDRQEHSYNRRSG